MRRTGGFFRFSKFMKHIPNTLTATASIKNKNLHLCDKFDHIYLNPTTFLVFVHICRCANENITCGCSQRDIARRLRLGKGSVQRGLKTLQKIGLISGSSLKFTYDKSSLSVPDEIADAELSANEVRALFIMVSLGTIIYEELYKAERLSGMRGRSFLKALDALVEKGWLCKDKYGCFSASECFRKLERMRSASVPLAFTAYQENEAMSATAAVGIAALQSNSQPEPSAIINLVVPDEEPMPVPLPSPVLQPAREASDSAVSPSQSVPFNPADKYMAALQQELAASAAELKAALQYVMQFKAAAIHYKEVQDEETIPVPPTPVLQPAPEAPTSAVSPSQSVPIATAAQSNTQPDRLPILSQGAAPVRFITQRVGFWRAIMSLARTGCVEVRTEISDQSHILYYNKN